MTPWLVIDCHYLCHRAYHTELGKLSWKQKATGVIHGFLRTLQMLKDEFRTDRVIFCFESSWSYRERLFPDYKCSRKNRNETPEQEEGRRELHRQIAVLRDEVLGDIGYRNIFQAGGLESDDLMALAAKQLDGDVILVTADSDLYQCLYMGDSTTIYNPQTKQVMDERKFRSLYGIDPYDWAEVKAIGGCSTDGVPGIKGIGEATALKFLRGELPPDSRWFKIITSEEGMKQRDACLKLVRLPFKDMKLPEIMGDEVIIESWREACRKWGLKSLAAESPHSSRKAIPYAKRKS